MTKKIPRVIAHRGFSAIAPENTLLSFAAALELAVDGIEFDVRFSNDLEVMVIHDAEIGRTTSGQGRVRDLGRSEIQACDAGSWFDSKFQDTIVPTLGQVVERIRDRAVQIVLEIKPDSWIPDDYVSRIMAHFPSSELRRRLLVISFDHELIAPPVEWPSDVRRGALVERGDPLVQADRIEAEVLALRRNLVSRRIIREAHESGLDVVAWTVDRPWQINRFVKWGVDAIISNRPDRVQQILRPHGA